MKTPLETRGSRANDRTSAQLGKKQPDATHAHRIAHVSGIRPLPSHVPAAAVGPGYGGWGKGGYHVRKCVAAGISACLVIPLDRPPRSAYSYWGIHSG